MLVITERKPRALRVKRGPFSDNEARQAFVVRGDRAVRVPIQIGLAGADDVELISGVSEGDEIIISDMKDYLHLAEVRIKQSVTSCQLPAGGNGAPFSTGYWLLATGNR